MRVPCRRVAKGAAIAALFGTCAISFKTAAGARLFGFVPAVTGKVNMWCPIMGTLVGECLWHPCTVAT